MTHKLLRHIQAILDSNGLEWTSQRNGVALRFDSAIVTIGVTIVGRQRIIVLQSNILSDLRKSDKQEVLTELNRLNCTTRFGKWTYYDEAHVIVLEHDLLGDHLQEAELMTALTSMARLADHHDDALQTRFGGVRAVESTCGLDDAPC